jgi:hypothetical protein
LMACSLFDFLENSRSLNFLLGRRAVSRWCVLFLTYSKNVCHLIYITTRDADSHSTRRIPLLRQPGLRASPRLGASFAE